MDSLTGMLSEPESLEDVVDADDVGARVVFEEDDEEAGKGTRYIWVLFVSEALSTYVPFMLVMNSDAIMRPPSVEL